MLPKAWALDRNTVEGFIADETITRGAAIACYTMFSIAPLLVVAVAIAGLAFGEEAVRSAVAEQLRALVGREGAEAVQAMERGVGEGGGQGTNGVPALVSIAVPLVTASGVFAELQGALNAVWKAVTVSYLLRAQALSIGLVAATGFLLLVSLLASAALAALWTWVGGMLPAAAALLGAAGFLVSFALTAALFAAIYKVLPDRRAEWRDVAVRAVGTTALFTVGKALIGRYIGGSGMARSYGAAGALVVVLLWVYYSAQTFLLGAEFTRAWAGAGGQQAGRATPIAEPAWPAGAARTVLLQSVSSQTFSALEIGVPTRKSSADSRSALDATRAARGANSLSGSPCSLCALGLGPNTLQASV